MNNDNKTSFMEDSSNHVTNLNRTLKKIKSDIIVDFIYQEQSGITIVTNKVIFRPLRSMLRMLTTLKLMRLKFCGYPNPNLTSKS